MCLNDFFGNILGGFRDDVSVRSKPDRAISSASLYFCVLDRQPSTGIKLTVPNDREPFPGGSVALQAQSQEKKMLETIIVILVIMWAVGAFAVHIGGGLIHLLLVIALVVLVIRILQGRRI